jgi:hypothetical protein
MRNWIAATTLLLVSTTHAHATPEPDRRYNMDDLQALAKKGQWAELIAHAADIRPTQRNAVWQTLLKQAVEGWLSRPRIQTNPLRAAMTAEALLERYPALAKDRKLMAKRNEVGLRAFRQCFARRYWAAQCERALRPFVAQRGTDSKTAFAAGKLVRLHVNGPRAVFYFALAMKRAAGSGRSAIAKRCADRELARALRQTLALPTLARQTLRDVRALSLGVCFKSVKKTVLDSLVTSKAARAALCQGLLSKNALTGTRRKKCARLLRSQTR